MNNTEEQELGPMMIAATSILKPPPLRIGRLGTEEHGITLPRTVPVKNLIAGAAGALLGLILAIPFRNAFFFALLPGIIATLTWTMSNWSPSRGETLTQYTRAVLTNRSRNTAHVRAGEKVGISIGIAPISRTAPGPVFIVAGAVEIQPDVYDERGVRRSAKNRNEKPDSGMERPEFRSAKDLGLDPAELRGSSELGLHSAPAAPVDEPDLPAVLAAHAQAAAVRAEERNDTAATPAATRRTPTAPKRLPTMEQLLAGTVGAAAPDSDAPDGDGPGSNNEREKG